MLYDFVFRLGFFGVVGKGDFARQIFNKAVLTDENLVLSAVDTIAFLLFIIITESIFVERNLHARAVALFDEYLLYAAQRLFTEYRRAGFTHVKLYNGVSVAIARV